MRDDWKNDATGIIMAPPCEIEPFQHAHLSTSLVHAVPPIMVIARPHPLSMEKVSTIVPHGLTLSEIVGPEASNCRIEIGGHSVPLGWWRYVRPRPGAVVHVTCFPQGGGGGGWKMIFR